MKVENVNGKLPENVAVPAANLATLKSMISTLPEKQKVLAEAVVTAIFERLDQLNAYRDELGVKQIDLILGRTEDLLQTKLDEYSENEKESVKEVLVEAFSEINSSSSNIDKTTKNEEQIANDSTAVEQQTETIIDVVKGILNESVDNIKQTIVEEKTTLEQPNSTKPIEENTEKNKKTENNVTKSEDKKEATAKESKKEPTKEKTENKSPKNKSQEFDDIKAFIQIELNKLQQRINDTIVKNFSVTSKQLKREKKKNKQMNLLLDTLNQIKSITYRVENFLANVGEHLMKFFDKNITKLAKIIAKGIMIIMAPVIAAFWLMIGPPLMLIAYGIFLIAKAIAANMPQLISSIGKAIEIMAQAVPIVASAVPKFMDIIMKVLELVGQIISFCITQLWPFIKNELWPFIKNEIWPFIKSFFEWFKAEVYEPILKPLLIWLKDRFIKFVEEAVMPNLKKILDWCTATLMPWIEKHVMPVLASVLALVKEVLDALKPWIKPLVDVIFSTLTTLLEIIKPVVIALAKFLAEVVMDLLKAIEIGYKFIRDSIIKPIWSFFTEVLPNFGGWLWKKIKALLPWGDNDKDKLETSSELAAKQLSTIEDYKQENARLEDKIKELTSEKGITEMKEKIEEQKKVVEKERKEVIEIDKGSVYDILTLAKKIDSTLIDITAKLIQQLKNLVTKLDNRSIENSSQTISQAQQSIEVNNVAVNEVSQNVAKQEKSNIETISTSQQQNLTILNSQMEGQKKQQDEKLQESNVIKEKTITQSMSLKEYLATMFDQVFAKLDEPITIPMPLGMDLSNPALTENL